MQYTLLDIKEAVAPAPELAELEQIAAEVDLTSRDLVSLGEVIADTFDETLSADGFGATAFVGGFVLGTRLTEGRPVRSLSTAINAVYAMGHQTVIARHCDLEGVADACAEIDTLARADDRTALNLLFELGLAVSLAIRLPRL